MWNLPLLVNMEIPGFSRCQRFIYITYCILSVFGNHLYWAILFLLYLLISITENLGGGPFSNSRGVSLLAKVRFTMLPFCGVSSLTKLRTFTLVSILNPEFFAF
jgi:hypothetical protein